VIIGYTTGKGDRNQTFGAMHIAERIGQTLHYRGKVGTGFDDSTAKEISSTLKKIKAVKRPDVTGKLLDEKVSTWIEPKAIAEISYSKVTPDNMFREPVFVRMRPDLA
jgi:ATP-dependent DNA ligase